jgi:hypothetical protein
VRRTPVLLLVCLVLAAVPAGAAAKGHPTVRESLAQLLAAAQIDQATYDRDLASYNAAQATLKRLRGRRFRELRAVIATLDRLSEERRLVASRLPVLFRTLDFNRRWWARGALLGYGQRVYEGDIVWQSYPGHGMQIQWLGTFGRAGGLFTGNLPKYDVRLQKVLDEARTLATARAGGIAWESPFQFDSAEPLWVSGLSAGTALEAYSKAAIRLKRPEYFQVAREALGVFRTPPPEGVAAGGHYLIYSSWPQLRVLNAFVQSLNGLHDFATLANDPEGRALFATGEQELRRELPRYDTGAWSLYSLGRESDLGYHVLVREFLEGLCERLGKSHLADPELYCATARNFTRYLREPPRIVFQASARPRVKRRAFVAFTLSKTSAVTLAVRRRGVVVASVGLHLGRGTHRIAWTPRRAGPVSVTVRAVDPAGNVGVARGAQTVAR